MEEDLLEAPRDSELMKRPEPGADGPDGEEKAGRPERENNLGNDGNRRNAGKTHEEPQGFGICPGCWFLGCKVRSEQF